MRKIISKFQCNGIIPAAEGYPTTANLNAVYANSDGSINEENASFSQATPSGNISICIDPNAKAHKFFTNGRYYYVTFELIPMTEQEIETDRVMKLSPKEQRDYWEEKTGIKQDYPKDL
jgi:hypothetical protein